MSDCGGEVSVEEIEFAKTQRQEAEAFEEFEGGDEQKTAALVVWFAW